MVFVKKVSKQKCCMSNLSSAARRSGTVQWSVGLSEMIYSLEWQHLAELGVEFMFGS